MTHLELFRCDGTERVTVDKVSQMMTGCDSSLEVSLSFPTLVLSRLLEENWATIQDFGKEERHYCPLHRDQAVPTEPELVDLCSCFGWEGDQMRFSLDPHCVQHGLT